MAGVPTATVGRLVTYLRALSELEGAQVDRTSSDDLARRAQVSAFQVRKDLAYCGRFGKRGSGYQVAVLVRELRSVLGLTKVWHVGIMGMGRLGQALAEYPSLGQYDFLLRGAFDTDAQKVGMKVGGLTVAHVDALADAVADDAIDMAFLSVPAAAAQEAADALVAAGVRGILNFAPTVIEVPEHVHVEAVDFLAGLKRLTYRMGTRSADALTGS
jgi:redox-sensing transcriptional repressor